VRRVLLALCAFLWIAPAWATIAFVGAGTYTASGTASVSLTRNATIASGDALIAVVSTQDKSGTSTVATLAGWTAVTHVVSPSNGGFFSETYVFWKIAGGSEPSSYTWSAGTQGTSYTGIDGVTVTYSGTASSSIINSFASATSTTTTLTIPALTETFQSGEVYIATATSSTNATVSTETPTLTQRFKNAGSDNSYYVGELTPASAPGSEALTGSGGAWGSASGIGFTIIPPGGAPASCAATRSMMGVGC